MGDCLFCWVFERVAGCFHLFHCLPYRYPGDLRGRMAGRLVHKLDDSLNGSGVRKMVERWHTDNQQGKNIHMAMGLLMCAGLLVIYWINGWLADARMVAWLIGYLSAWLIYRFLGERWVIGLSVVCLVYLIDKWLPVWQVIGFGWVVSLLCLIVWMIGERAEWPSASKWLVAGFWAGGCMMVYLVCWAVISGVVWMCDWHGIPL